jgi:hypothetical protein
MTDATNFCLAQLWLKMAPSMSKPASLTKLGDASRFVRSMPEPNGM